MELFCCLYCLYSLYRRRVDGILSYILSIYISEFAFVVCEETAALPVLAVDPDFVSVVELVSGHHGTSAAVICHHAQAGSRRQIAYFMRKIIGCIMDVVNRTKLSCIAAGNFLQFRVVKFLFSSLMDFLLSQYSVIWINKSSS